MAAYVRDRDPLKRDITLIFVPVMTLFVNSVMRELGVTLPWYIRAIPLALLLAQPYLTLRLTAKLGPVPRWLQPTMLGLYVLSAIPVTFVGRPLPSAFLLFAVVVFVVTEAVAATYLLKAARVRTGAPRVRLNVAAAATYLFSIMLITLGFNGVLYPGQTTWLTAATRIIALVCAIGYLTAFMPPRWLRQLFAAQNWYRASETLQQLPATASNNQVWQRFVEVVQQTVGADAACLVIGSERSGVQQLGCSGIAVAAPAGRGMPDIEQLLRVTQPISVPAADEGNADRVTASLPALAVHYAHSTDARHVTVVAVPVSATAQGALLMLDRYRTLFTDDDLRLIATLGGQAAILVERGAVLSEQRRLAERLTQSVDALTHASQAKSDFLASMSHELRTPLNAIIGFSDLMRAEQPDGDRRSVPAEWVDHIHSSGRHLLGLINDILDLAKVEAGRLELHPEALRLDATASQLITGLRPLIERKQLQVIVDSPPLSVYADPVRFRQILENLLSNAIKFTPEGGKISITAVGAGPEVAITVADSGVGIAPADHERVFEEFQQVGDPHQRKAGTGLGLALTRRLVQAHGGSIALRSALGAGSQFTITLPEASAATANLGEPAVKASTVTEQMETPESVEPHGAARGRVLIIDDDPRAGALLRTYLVDAGYEVMVAVSGESGLSAAGAWRPDAILLDVILPGIDGWDVIRELKLDQALQDIPVFFASIMDDRGVGLALGAEDYFVKPVDHDALLAQLARHVMPKSPGPSSVLVVDHDENTRRVVADHLRLDGIDVVAVADGSEGLRLSRQRPFDLIICDLRMTEVDSFELLAALQGHPASRGIPVLALTEPNLPDADRMQLSGKVIGTVPRDVAVADGLRQWIDLAATANALSSLATPSPEAAMRSVADVSLHNEMGHRT